MAQVRGTLVLNTIEFIREHYGPQALPEVLRALPAKNAKTFLSALREASWEPLEDLDAYMVAAQAVLAPKDESFFREMGRFAGRHDRGNRAFGVMLHDLDTAARMAKTLWRSFFDEGSLEVAERDARGALLRIRDFPTTRSLCQRVIGSLEGQLSTPAAAVAVTKTACVLDGAAFCEYSLDWSGREAGSGPI